MKIKKAVAFTTALGLALAGIALSVPAANADPVSGGYSITGSDTLQDAVNAIVNGTQNGTTPFRTTAGGNTVGSFDAFGSSAIQLKPNTAFIGRPSGSGDGKKSLSRSLDGQPWVKNGISATVTGLVDLARSSSGAGSGSNGGINTSGPLIFIPFGRDAVSYAIKFGAGATLANTAGIDQLTTAQLTAIFGNATPVTLGSNNTVVVPKLPQPSSGTRQFFLGALGLGSASNPAGVSDAATTTLAENDSASLQPAANTVQIIPFSAASFIAQANGAAPVNTTASITLGSPNGVAPYTVSGTTLVPNLTFYSSSTFGRDTYIIAPADRVVVGGANFDQNLADLVDPTKTGSLTYFGASASPATSKAVKIRFGFLAPSDPTTFRTNYFS